MPFCPIAARGSCRQGEECPPLVQATLACRCWWSRVAAASSLAPECASQQVSALHHLPGASRGVWGPAPPWGMQADPTPRALCTRERGQQGWALQHPAMRCGMLEAKAFLHGNSWESSECLLLLARPEVLLSRTGLLYSPLLPSHRRPRPKGAAPAHFMPSYLKSRSHVQAARVAEEEDAVKDEQCQGGLPVRASLQKPTNDICLQLKMSPLLLFPPHRYRLTNGRVWVAQHTEWIFLTAKAVLFSLLFFFSLNYSNRRISRPTLSCCCSSCFIAEMGCLCPNP